MIKTEITDTQLLKLKMHEKGFTNESMGKALNLTVTAFFNKTHNKSQFYASEIVLISNLLCLTPLERDKIFLSGLKN